MAQITDLTDVAAGMPILFGGNRVTHVPADVAARFRPGDRLLVVQETGDILLVPAKQQAIAAGAVDRAYAAFGCMGTVSDEQVTHFYEVFASRLDDEAVWGRIAEANGCDVDSARSRGRSTTRLQASDGMRRDMIAGLRAWRDAPPQRGRIVETIDQPGLIIEQLIAGLGVVGFVFEGRPNVFADATGVLRGGNTVVFRIGRDALGTAKAIVKHALAPALGEAGLPEGAAVLVESADHAAGWAMFSDARLGLAVARGSGRAVAQLGSVARQSGIPVSLHGTGGAWIIAGEDASPHDFAAAVYNSLDRKVCNTLNVCCIPRARVGDLIAPFLDALHRAGERRGYGCKLHVEAADACYVPKWWFTTKVTMRRAEGEVVEPLADLLAEGQLGREWEWEETPEVTLKIVDSTDEAVTLFNSFSPRLAGSLISPDAERQRRFYEQLDAPFVGNGFTRWVDGQYALHRPELGLSNWQHGRLFTRGAVLSGTDVYTVRTRVTQTDPELHR